MALLAVRCACAHAAGLGTATERDILSARPFFHLTDSRAFASIYPLEVVVFQKNFPVLHIPQVVQRAYYYIEKWTDRDLHAANRVAWYRISDLNPGETMCILFCIVPDRHARNVRA